MTRSYARGYAYAGATACLFASFVLGSRLSLTTSLLPRDLCAIRFAVAAILLSPVLMRRGLASLSLWQALILAFTGGGGFAAAAYTGFSLTPASHGSALIHGVLPLTTLLLQGLWLKKRATILHVTASTVTVAGIALMLSDSLSSVPGSQAGGDLSLLAASALWSAYGILLARWRIPSFQATAIVASFSAVFYLPFYALSGSTSLQTASWADLALQAVLQGALVGVLSSVCYAKAISFLGPPRVAAALSVVPVAVTIGGVYLLHEEPSIWAWCGVLIVAAGVLLHAHAANKASTHL